MMLEPNERPAASAPGRLVVCSCGHLPREHADLPDVDLDDFAFPCIADGCACTAYTMLTAPPPTHGDGSLVLLCDPDGKVRHAFELAVPARLVYEGFRSLTAPDDLVVLDPSDFPPVG
jgi:hypothetical protein